MLIFSSGLFVSAAPGDISTVAGNGSGAFSGDDGPAVSASIRYPQAIALDTLGNLFITDLVNQRIRRVDVVTGIMTTIAGTGSSNYNGDGIPAVTAQLNYPDGVAVAPNGDVYIADFTNQRVRRIDAETDLISTVAGSGVAGFDGDDLGCRSGRRRGCGVGDRCGRCWGEGAGGGRDGGGGG